MVLEAGASPAALAVSEAQVRRSKFMDFTDTFFEEVYLFRVCCCLLCTPCAVGWVLFSN